MTDIVFAPASPAELPAIVALLREAGLPADDLTAAGLTDFEVALDAAGTLVGVAGLNVAGDAALLRSVAVAAAWRGRGLGRHLVARCEEAARAAGVATIHLLTTTAADCFRRLGYTDAARETVPAAIAAHPQFRGQCPATAACLEKKLQSGPNATDPAS